MAVSDGDLIGPSGVHHSELHKPTDIGRDAGQVGPLVTIDKYEDGRIYVIALNRPHRMNSMATGSAPALYEAWAQFRDDPTARVAILTGRGSRAFCVGADLIEKSEKSKAGAAGHPLPELKPEPRLYPLAEAMNLWKPTIAAINGFAIAGGFKVAMQCDIRIAAEHARVGVAEVRWNLGGGAWMAPITRQIGLGIALELMLWGDTQFTAQRAYEVGWVNKVVPAEDLMATAMQYAQRALDMAPRAVRAVKQALYRGYYMTPEAAVTFGSALDQGLEGMKDSVEGPSAFSEKRRPKFIDR
ncbi:MAG: enoyl-CoA hydratase-related protein [Dehalococcoidia bacterium]|nr:enoyl-CoA hydratase-related protein [Dehalococcoidia bacterium]